MKNKVVPATEENILKSVKILKNEGVVVAPTETVYALVANVFSKNAVEKVFEIKKRPKNKPLSCNISNFKMLCSLTDCTFPIFFKLIKAFWPGPLTVVVKKKSVVPDFVTANKDSVAIRFSSDVVLQRLTNLCGFALVVPSANISGTGGKTTALEVYREFENNVGLILDSGETKFKVESTIVLVKKDGGLEILREGAIKKDEINRII